MERKSSNRLWVVLAVGLGVVAALAVLISALDHRPDTSPAMPSRTSTSTLVDDSAIALVNARPISYSSWVEAALLDQVLNGVSGQPIPDPDETLERLINEELILQAVPPEGSPTEAEIEQQITALENAWGVSDQDVIAALEAADQTRAAFSRSVARLLVVQSGMEELQDQGYELAKWIQDKRSQSQISILRDPDLSTLGVISVLPTTSPIPTPKGTALPSFTSPIAAGSQSPAADPATLAIPEVAPDFTLERAGGGSLTLSDQLAKGPVVLAFFQRFG
jgi:hypothetical protein